LLFVQQGPDLPIRAKGARDEREIRKLPGQYSRKTKLFNVTMPKTDVGVSRIEWSEIQLHGGRTTLMCWLLSASSQGYGMVG